MPRYHGTILNGTGTYGTISSQRELKQDIADARSYWNDFKLLEYSKYRYIKSVEKDPDEPYQLGLIVDNVEAIFPNLIQTTPTMETQDVAVLDADGNAVYEQIEEIDADGNAVTVNKLDTAGNPIPITEEKLVDIGTVTKGIKSSIVEGPIMGCVVQELQTRLEAAESKITALESA